MVEMHNDSIDVVLKIIRAIAGVEQDFFFSSTRRHTRYWRDWSSDVCSSDLIAHAGTPGLSDPGFRIVRACRRRGLPVVPVPGPSALVAVLSASGLPTNGFLFAGFLSPKSAARTAFLNKYRDFDYTLA